MNRAASVTSKAPAPPSGWAEAALEKINLARESLQECGPNVEDHDWGPSYSMAKDRRTKALRALRSVEKELHAMKTRPFQVDCETLNPKTKVGP